jgi:pimeloyl-ACP methyl ester carboxylesterase
MISPPDGALSLFMDELVKLVKDNPDYEITLIGHSMGAFILNEMLCRYDMLFYKNLVYMAPACSCSEAARALRPYLEKYPKSTFYNLCIQPNLDSKAMMAGGLLPRGSVLTWIDLYFTNPLTSNDHCLGIWYNAMYSMPRLLGEVQDQCVIKAFGVKDPVTNTIDVNMPEDHTDFSDTKLRFWEPEFWQRPKTWDGKVCPFVDRLIKIGKD